MNHREAVLFPGQTVEIDRVGGAIDVLAQRFQNMAHGVKLSSVDEDAVGPAYGGIHVGNVELGHGTFIEHGAEVVAVLDSSEIDDGAHARIEAKTEAPVLPADFAAFDLEAVAKRLRDADGSGAGARRGFQILIIYRHLVDGSDAFFDDLKHFLFGGVDFNLQALDVARPAEIDAMTVGAAAHHDAMAFEFGQREVAEGIGKAYDGIEVGDAALLEGFDDAGIFFHDFVEGAEFRSEEHTSELQSP